MNARDENAQPDCEAKLQPRSIRQAELDVFGLSGRARHLDVGQDPLLHLLLIQSGHPADLDLAGNLRADLDLPGALVKQSKH